MNVEQKAALKEYAAQNGKKWKQSLQADWMKGGSFTYRGEWAYLQQLRNTIGPKGLKNIDIETI